MEIITLTSSITRSVSEASAVTAQLQSNSALTLAAEHSSVITDTVSLESKIDLEEV